MSIHAPADGIVTDRMAVSGMFRAMLRVAGATPEDLSSLLFTLSGGEALPDTLYDDYSNRASAAEAAEMRVGVHMHSGDLKCEMPKGLSENEMRKWSYQRYIKDYLRVVASIDDNVGRVLDYLEDTNQDGVLDEKDLVDGYMPLVAEVFHI